MHLNDVERNNILHIYISNLICSETEKLFKVGHFVGFYLCCLIQGKKPLSQRKYGFGPQATAQTKNNTFCYCLFGSAQKKEDEALIPKITFKLFNGFFVWLPVLNFLLKIVTIESDHFRHNSHTQPKKVCHFQRFVLNVLVFTFRFSFQSTLLSIRISHFAFRITIVSRVTKRKRYKNSLLDWQFPLNICSLERNFALGLLHAHCSWTVSMWIVDSLP